MTCLYPGDKQTVFSADSPASGQASQAVHISPTRFGQSNLACSAEIAFSGAPGTFDYRLQEADTDQDAYYQDVAGAAVTTVNSGNKCRIDAQIAGKYVRIVAHTQTQNAVTVTATIHRV